MARISPIHYIQPSAIGIVPNANGNADDIAVAVNAGAKIKVFAPQAGIKTSNGTYREWTLEGRNRRLADSTKEYTIYARLTKQEGYSAYIVFAPKTWRDGEWRDKYPYVTVNGLTVGESSVDGPYWYVKIGDVSLPENGLRAVTLDTGILGMEEFNTQWALNPDALPLRVELDCKVGGKTVGLSPYLFWGQLLTLTAVLKEGWTGSDLSRFHHWQITRDSGDTTADEEWNASSRLESFANTGIIRLSHERNSDDDFNGAVSASYTIVAMEQQESEDPEIEYEYVPLASTTIHIMAETSEVFSLSFSTAIVSLNPQSGAITPSGGVVVLVRATDQRNRVFDLTVGQLRSAGITVSYAPVGSDTWTPLVFSGESTAIAAATIAASVFVSAKKSVNVRVTRPVPSEDDPEVMVEKELNRATLAFVRDGEDSHEREWIFLRSTEPITFGDAESEHPLPSLIARGEVNPSGAAAGSDTDKNQEGWVPNGWWDEMRGTTEDVPYEYGAYRDFVNDDNGGHWGDFTDPVIWSHYGKDGTDGRNGIDAKDIEWAYIRTKTNVAPVILNDSTYTDSNGNDYTEDDHLPHVDGNSNIENNEGTYECTDDPKGVDGTWKYEWEIKRSKGAAVDGRRSWDFYQGTMTLHNNLAENAFIVDLDNDNDQYGTDSDSKVLVEQTRQTTVSLYDGSAQQTLTSLTATLAYEDDTSVPSSVATVVATPSTGVVAVTVKQNATSNTHSEIRASITAVCAKGSKQAVFTLRKVMGGAPGLNPVIYQLSPTQKVFQFSRSEDNTLTPSSRSTQINVARTEGNTTTILSTAQSGVTYSWGFDESSAAQATGKAVGTSISISSAQAASHHQVWVELSTGDRETLPIVKDGINGQDGTSPNTNILLRTIFDKGIDFVKEKWTGTFNYIHIDEASDTLIEGHKCIRINASTLPTGEYADFSQNVIARVKPATWYTLSFNYFSTGGSTDKFLETFVWSGASEYTAIDVSEGMYIDGVHQSAAATRGDGCVQWPSDWTGKRHFVTFKTVGTFNTDYVNILIRCNAGGQAAICMPKLEEGKTATAYMANDDDLIGKDGKDGWMITANPANVILTQALTNASASFSSAVVSFVARKGSAADSFLKVVSVSSDEFYVSLPTGENPGTVIVSSPKKHTPEGSTEQVYYTEGSFVAQIEATDPDTNQSVIFAVTVLCYANLLGTWKTIIEGDVETSVAQKITYGYDHETGQVGSLEAVGKYIRSSEENISKLQKDTEKANLLPIGGWRLNDGSYNPADYDKAHDRSYDQDMDYNDIYSSVVELSKGDYCFSGYVPSGRSFDTTGNTIQVVYGCSAADPGSGWTYINASSVGDVANDTIKINGNTYVKRYAVFSIPSTAMCSVNLWGDDGYGDVVQPKLVAGTVPEKDSTMSVINQTAEEINLSVSNLSDSTQTALNLKANSADLTTMQNGLETAGVHLDGENSKIRLNAETTEISGDLYVPRVETTGNPNRKIVIDSETFRVYNQDGIAGISLGWDSDGEPFLLFTNADGSRYVRISYSDIDIAGSQFTADAFAQLYYLPVVSGSTQCDWKLYGNNYDEYTKYYRYSAAKNTATGVYSSEIPDRPGQYLTIYQRRRSERDGKVMTTNVLSDVLGETTQYIANGYYVSHMHRPVSREQEARGIICKYVWLAALGNVPETSLQVTYMQKIETQEGDYEYMFCNADASDAAYVFDANRFIFNI